jgi:16S rRNA processing protein RimM
LTRPQGLLLAGEIGKPHGVHGDVYVVPISDDPHRFDAGMVLTRSGGGTLAVERSRRHRDRLLVKFSGIDDRSAAERLSGPLYVPTEALRALRADEWWEHELIGMRVEDVAGREVGTVSAVLPGAAQDLLAVDTPAGERLVPLVTEIVVGIEEQARRVHIDPPPGLLD